MSDMTAEERAASLANRCAEWSIDLIAEEISYAEQAAAARAREEEREACAALCEKTAEMTHNKLQVKWVKPARLAAYALASAIRARTEGGG